MQHLSKEYIVLFNAISEAESSLRHISQQLKRAQQLAEEFYISDEKEISSKAVQGKAAGG